MERIPSIESELEQIKTDPSVGRLYSNWLNLRELASGLIRQFDSIRRTDFSDDGQRVLVVVNGLPSSGKTFVRERLAYYLQSMLNYGIGGFNWEGGEIEARAKGFITTPPYLPYSEEELRISSNFFLKAGAQAIRDHKVTIAEAPILPGTIISKGSKERFIGRELGIRAVFKLKRFPDKVGELYRELTGDKSFQMPRNLDVYNVSLVGGDLLRSIAYSYRAEMKGALTLKEARVIAELFGKQPPVNNKQWRKMANDGASPAQLLVIDREFDKLRQYINNRRGKNLKGQDLEVYLALFNSLKLGLSADRIFVGFNNPTGRQLGVDEDLLLRFLRKQGSLSNYAIQIALERLANEPGLSEEVRKRWLNKTDEYF